MDRNHPLHNVLREENWDSIKGASEQNEERDDSLKPMDENQNQDEENNQGNDNVLYENMKKLDRHICNVEKKTEDQAKLISQVVEKINKLVKNNNDFEEKLEQIEKRINDLRPQTNVKDFSKKEEKETTKEEKETKDTSTMEDEIKPEDVSIEKMFNFSNKKFD